MEDHDFLRAVISSLFALACETRKLKFSLVFADMNSGSGPSLLEYLTPLYYFRISSAAVPEGAVVYCFSL
jgi:hypothetical protein